MPHKMAIFLPIEFQVDYTVAMEMMNERPSRDDFRLWLQSEWMMRCKRNPRFSLRSFALVLDMDSSTVSQLISGKRKASKKVISKICERLSADQSLLTKFLVQEQRNSQGDSKLKMSQTDYQLLNEDAIAVLSNWYYFAILEIVNVDHFQSSYTWIANRLGLTTPEIKIAVERLTRLNLLSVESGKIKRTEKFLTTYAPGQTSKAQKEFQKQVLDMALEAIDEVPIELRDMSNMTMAIDIDKIPEARKMITKFRRELSDFLEDGERTQVFQLAVQLYPISK